MVPCSDNLFPLTLLRACNIPQSFYDLSKVIEGWHSLNQRLSRQNLDPENPDDFEAIQDNIFGDSNEDYDQMEFEKENEDELDSESEENDRDFEDQNITDIAHVTPPSVNQSPPTNVSTHPDVPTPPATQPQHNATLEQVILYKL